jgi:hypothetical protein
MWVSRIATIANLTNITNILVTDIDGNVVAVNATVSQIYDLIVSGNISIDVNLSAILEAITNLSIDLQDIFYNINETINYNFNYTNNLIDSGVENIILNITDLRQNMTNNFNYTNSLILDTQVIANQSVDRNDSYLAWLLYKIINSTGAPMTGNVTSEIYEESRAIYMSDWSIKVRVYDEYNNKISSPDVACTVVTSQHPLQYMDAEGDHFAITLFIYEYGSFTRTVNCFRT